MSAAVATSMIVVLKAISHPGRWPIGAPSGNSDQPVNSQQSAVNSHHHGRLGLKSQQRLGMKRTHHACSGHRSTLQPAAVVVLAAATEGERHVSPRGP